MIAPARKTVAIYCRKSTEDGLDQEFNSLDAQRQSCEQYIASQRHEGWVASAVHYDDGGFSGSNTERPALQRLLEDVRAGKVQIVAVYKLDRLSRSLIDFVGLLQVMEQHRVAFVSVTQQFNTATPMGRLMLHVLICFAQFERENMIERVRDKVAATKRLGKWCGGRPSLGYDVPPGGGRLVINTVEAERVRTIFALYLEHRSTARVLRLLQARGWTCKAWTNGAGKPVGGQPFSKSVIAHTLGNILYTGRIRYRGEIITAEHPAIIDIPTWERVQQVMASQHASGGAESRTRHAPLLKGLLRCATCGCGMTYTYAMRGAKRYGYYTCHNARVQGAATCPMPNLPAAEVERLVVDEIAAICRDPQLIDRVVSVTMAEQQAVIGTLRTRWQAALALAAQAAEACARAPDDDAQRALREQADAQATLLREQVLAAERAAPTKPAARQLLRDFAPVWAELSPRERQDILQHLVASIAIDGDRGSVAFTFRSDGIAALANRAGAA